jgi:hypothetical protein
VLPFRFEVEDPARASARSYAARPDLHVLAGGALRTMPVPESTPDARSYHAVLILVNASTHTLALPPARVTLNVFRIGDPLPCTTQVSLFPVTPIAAGGVDVEHVAVTCLRDRRGAYEVRVLVAFEDEAPVEAGRFQVRVTDDLGVIVPLP